ncbi:MAG: hypothetical protein H0V60_10945 [Actinobacteria bacterium]|nr:hypothetical protein [Actinomycetota bacterium]
MAQRKDTEDSLTRRFEQTQQSHTCSAWVSYQLPRSGKPFFIAACSCGWAGWPQASSKKAFTDARSHTPKVSGAIFGMSPKGGPPGR